MNKKPVLVILTSFALLQSPVAYSDADTVAALIQHQVAVIADAVANKVEEVAQMVTLEAGITKVINTTTDSFMALFDENSQKAVAAQGIVGDGLSQTAIDVFNQETVFWMTPDIGTCDRKTAKVSVGQASKKQEQVRAQVNAMVATRVRGSSESGGGGGAKINTLKVHDDWFCAQSDVDRKYCSSVSQYADFDLNAANFMQPKNNTYDPTEKKAAALFIVNTTTPTPLLQSQLNYSGNSTEVKKLREVHNAYAARINSASEAMSDVLALNSSPDDSPGSKSLMELIKNQVEGRAMGEGGAAFTTALTKGGPGTAARSAAEMESMTNLLLLKIYETLLRQQVLAAETNSMVAHQAMEAQVLSREASLSGTEPPKN